MRFRLTSDSRSPTQPLSYLQQARIADPALKPILLYIFLLILQHKWMFLSTMQTLPFEGHSVAYQCKGLNQSNVVCEYDVNMSTNEKVIREKRNFNANC